MHPGKLFYLIVFMPLCLVGQNHSSTVAYDSLNINNINARINNVGNHFWGFPGGEYAHYFIPKNSRISSIFNSALWIGGLDDTNGLHLAAERYRQIGEDYWAGPISSIYDSAYDQRWNQIWKVSRSEIEYHKAHWSDPAYIPIEVINNWPGNGDVSSGQLSKLAPFYDLDNDGLYNPLNGDYPIIYGDQAIFFIFNDARNQHTESQGKQLGLEVHGMAFAYECMQDSALWNSLFMHYEMINLSNHDYHDVYFGIFTDFDIGYPWDDFSATDTILNSVFNYNGDWFDGERFYDSYGKHPPVQSMSLLSHSMDFSMIYGNTGPWYQHPPLVDYEYYYALKALWTNGQPLPMQDSLIPYRHAYPGDPLDSISGWTMINAHNIPSNYRAVGSHGPIIWERLDTIKLDFVYVFGRDFTGNNLSSIPVFRTRIGNIIEYYETNSSPCGPLFSVSEINKQRNQAFKVYPNPNTGFLNIELYEEYGWREYRIFDVFGRLMKDGKLKDQTILDISLLNPGIYFVQMVFDDFIQTKRIIKMN